MDLHVIVQSDDGSQRTDLFPGDEALTIGRHPLSGLRLDSDLVSRHHAVVHAERDAIRVEDLSTNGTIAGDLLLRRDTVDVPYGTPIVVGNFTVFVYPAESGGNRELSPRPSAVASPHPPRTTSRHAEPDEDATESRAAQRATIEPVAARAGSGTNPAAGLLLSRSLQGSTTDELGPLRKLIDDPAVSSIIVFGPEEIYVETHGVIRLFSARFESAAALEGLVRTILERNGHSYATSGPWVRAELPGDFRLEAILPPASPRGPCLSMRRLLRETLSLDGLVELGALSIDAASLLRACVMAELSIFVTGSMGAGRTSVLNALMACIPDAERVVVLESTRELRIDRPNVCILEARPDAHDERTSVTIAALLRSVRNLRPQRIVLGDASGRDTDELFETMASAPASCLAVFHADDALELAHHLDSKRQARRDDYRKRRRACPIDIVCHVERTATGRRIVTRIAELIGAEGTGYALRDLFLRRDESDTSDGELVPTGAIPTSLARLHAHGMDIPASVYAAAKHT